MEFGRLKAKKYTEHYAIEKMRSTKLMRSYKLEN